MYTENTCFYGDTLTSYFHRKINKCQLKTILSIWKGVYLFLYAHFSNKMTCRTYIHWCIFIAFTCFWQKPSQFEKCSHSYPQMHKMVPHTPLRALWGLQIITTDQCIKNGHFKVFEDKLYVIARVSGMQIIIYKRYEFSKYWTKIVSKWVFW